MYFVILGKAVVQSLDQEEMAAPTTPKDHIK